MLPLGLVGQLVAVGIEELDAVVGVGVVRGRDHHAEVGPQRAGQHGDRRRRHRPEQEHVHADRREARHQGGLDHVARQARILADHHAVPARAVGELLAGGHADLERDLRGHRVRVGEPANAVRAEILPRHAPPLVSCSFDLRRVAYGEIGALPCGPLCRHPSHHGIKLLQRKITPVRHGRPRTLGGSAVSGLRPSATGSFACSGTGRSAWPSPPPPPPRPRPAWCGPDAGAAPCTG